MKITFCADLHINLSKYGRANQDGLNFRTMDFLSAFEKTVDKNIAEIKPDYFCILGDVFENPHPQNNIREFFQDQIVKLVNANIEVVILVGNHDICKHHHALQPIQPISKLNNISDKIHVFANPSVMDKPSLPLLLAFPHPMAVERQEISMREAFFNFCKESKAAINEAKGNNRSVIFLGHFGVGGAKMNDGYLNKSKEGIQVKDLDVIGADFVFLGDYHVHQKLATKNTEAYYVGSLERTDFSDLKSDKGFMVINCQDGKCDDVSFVKNETVRPMLNIEGNAEQIKVLIDENNGVLPNSITKIKFKGNLEEYKEFSKLKKELKKQLETDNKAQHVFFAQDVENEEQDRKVRAIQKEIEKTGYLEASDVSDLAVEVTNQLITDEGERQATKDEISDIINTVKAEQNVNTPASSGSKSSVLIHAVKMQNFLRYGESDNIIEFDQGAKYFLELPKNVLDTGGSSEKASEFLKSVTSTREPRILTILGMTDGDKNESNGAGKSTVFEAISYGFYEKLIREYVRRPESKGPSTISIVCEDNGIRKKEAFVEILFSTDGALWMLKRGRKVSKNNTSHTPILSLLCLTDHQFNKQPDDEGVASNSQVVSHSGHRTKDDNQTILDLVKMSFDTFVNSVMYGQNDAGQFITGSDKVRKEIIINALQLGIIDDYLNECRKRKKQTNEELISIRSKIALMEQDGNTVNVKDVERQIEVNVKEIISIEATIKKLTSDLDTLKQSGSLSACQHAVKEVELRQQMLKQKEQEIVKQKQSFVEQKQDVDATIMKFKKDLQTLEYELSDNVTKTTKANKIVQDFNMDEYKKQVDLIAKAKEYKPIRTKEKQELDNQKEELFGKISIARRDVENVMKEIANLNDKLQDFANSDVITCSECKQPVTKEHIESRLQEKQKELSECSKKLRECENAQKPLLEKVQAVQKKIIAIENQMGKESSLVASFKDYNASQEQIKELEKYKVKLQASQTSLKQDIKKQTDKLNDIVKSVASVDKTFEAEIKQLNEDCQKAVEQRDKAESAAKVVKQQIVDAEKVITEHVQKKEALVLVNVEHKTTIKNEESKQLSLVKLKKQMDVATQQQSRNVFIESLLGINGIQTKLVDKYIPLLNSYIKDFISIISDSKIGVEVVAQDAGDANGKNSKLDILISGDMSSDCFLASGGEGIKIKLAVSLGLGLLSFVRSDTSPEFIALDEVFSYVDEYTKERIFLILDKLKEQFRDIFVISHDPAIVERIVDIIVVNKINGVSTVAKQYWERK